MNEFSIVTRYIILYKYIMFYKIKFIVCYSYFLLGYWFCLFDLFTDDGLVYFFSVALSMFDMF